MSKNSASLKKYTDTKRLKVCSIEIFRQDFENIITFIYTL